MKYISTFIPVMKKGTVSVDGKDVECDALELMQRMGPEDELWLMMGSTNAAVALGAYRKGVKVHQISYPRARSSNGEQKVSLDGIREIVERQPQLFYSLYPQQSEVLEIISAWQDVEDAMEARKEYANRLRARVMARAVIEGRKTKEQLEEEIEQLLGKKSKGIKPADAGMQYFLEKEKKAEQELAKVIGKSGLYNQVFKLVGGVGAKLAARFIAGIERIERFQRAKDLSNYAGLLPRGKDGRLPSRRQAGQNNEQLSRSPKLNTACFNLQEWLFIYGKNTELGAFMREEMERRCPCTAEQRKNDPELRKRYAAAVKQARILTTRRFLEEIVWPKWRSYVGTE